MLENKEIERYVRLHYGNLVTVRDVVNENDRCVARLKVDFPRVFTDDKTHEKTIRFIPLGQVGTIQFDLNFKAKKFTPRNECGKRISVNLGKLVNRSERIVVNASAKKLAKVAIVREALNPIFILADHLLDYPEVTAEELRGLGKPPRFKQYLSLLEQLKIVEKRGQVFTDGAVLSDLKQQAFKEGGKRDEQEERFKESMIAYVLSTSYDNIHEVFHINRMQTYVHADNTYYEPSLEAEKLLYQNEDSLISRYHNMYGFKSPLRLRPVLKELVKVGAMEYDGAHYVGVTELFGDMQAIKADMPFTESLIA